jgi:site-specific recombinase XerD
MQTICSTGIRISELNFITLEAIQRGKADIQAKGKRRTVFFPKRLCHMLKEYAKKQGIKKGAIFVTKGGLPMNRSNIWTSMKKLCKEANVFEEKVFPHNLRHLFARTYYSQQKDIVRLADILGHSSVNTTRIYTMESGAIHRKQIQKLGLLRE